MRSATDGQPQTNPNLASGRYSQPRRCQRAMSIKRTTIHLSSERSSSRSGNTATSVTFGNPSTLSGINRHRLLDAQSPLSQVPRIATCCNPRESVAFAQWRQCHAFFPQTAGKTRKCPELTTWKWLAPLPEYAESVSQHSPGLPDFCRATPGNVPPEHANPVRVPQFDACAIAGACNPGFANHF